MQILKAAWEKSYNYTIFLRKRLRVSCFFIIFVA